jgi:hypothetical protein
MPEAALARAASLALAIRAGNPYLVGDYDHHEKKVESKRPKDEEFGTFEVAPGDEMLFGSHELVVFERGQDPALIGGCGLRVVLFHFYRLPQGLKPNSNLPVTQA